jgi:hypothetical protein
VDLEGSDAIALVAYLQQLGLPPSEAPADPADPSSPADNEQP